MTLEVSNAVQFLFADHAGDFGAAPATSNNSQIDSAITPVDVQMDAGGLSAGSAWQSTKFDFGTPRPALFSLDFCIEFASAVTAQGIVYFYLAGSPSATAAQGNAGGATGADGSFTMGAGVAAQFQRIGHLVVRNNAVNIGFCGFVVPKFRYGSLIVDNQADTAFATTADEIHGVLTSLEHADG